MTDRFLFPLSEVDDYLAVLGQGAGWDKVNLIGAHETDALELIADFIRKLIVFAVVA